MHDTDFRKVRLEKLEKLKALGVNPYPASFDKKQTVEECVENEGKTVKTAGKIFSYREHGNIAFADLKDETGKIQIFFQKKLLGDFYKNLKLLDIGDFIGVEGEVIKTTAGQISIAPKSYTLLTKSLSPIPSEFFGLKDEETKLRKRYLDLMMNPELRELFKKKNLFWQTIREYLVKNGGLEVETPALVNTTGGADARPFTTHHNAFALDVYLRISPELYLKRLLVAGFEKVFEIGRIFRNEGVSDEHMQDYTQMEMYWAYKDYDWLMDFIEKMLQEVIKRVFGSLKTKWKDQIIDWSGKWPRIEYMKLLSEKWNVNVENSSVKELYELAKKLKVKLEPNLGKGRVLDYLYKKTIRPFIIQPVFLINHPVEVEPLAKRLDKNPNNVQRMQILVMGSELGKGFSELNDPLDQKKRFEEQQALRDAGDEEAQMMDEDFVEALEYGMPPAAGFGMSERFFAMLVGKSVREMQFFPLMKPEIKNKI
jgi:lysyl-tRNA synthetase, class II